MRDSRLAISRGLAQRLRFPLLPLPCIACFFADACYEAAELRFNRQVIDAVDRDFQTGRQTEIEGNAAHVYEKCRFRR